MLINLKNLDFVILDCDGVILDSNKIKTDAFRETLHKYSTKHVNKLINYHKKNGGISRKIKFEYFFKKILKVDNNLIINHSLKLFESIALKKLINAKYIKGVKKFIKALNKNNIKIFIVSGAIQKELRRIFFLKKYDQQFELILGTPKTKDEHVKNIIKKYSLNVKKGIFFGDSKIDYLVAKKYKIEFIFVSEKTEWTDFKKLKKVNIINNFLDINV